MTRCEVCHANDPMTVRLCGACIASAALRVTLRPGGKLRNGNERDFPLPNTIEECHELLRWHQQRDDEQHAWIEYMMGEVERLERTERRLMGQLGVPVPSDDACADPGRRNGATRPRRRRSNGVTVG